MSVNALTFANGADVLQRSMQPAQQSGAAPVADNTKNLLKTALAEAQISASELIAASDPVTSGSLLNVYG
jgi:hypothetical protein